MPEAALITTESVQRLQGARVLVIGDLMLDAYMLGDTERISPEAPVPIVRVEEEQSLLGGAGNVASSIAALGGKATLIGITGKDAHAERICALVKQGGISPALLALGDRPTTTKTRVMARRQQMLRLDHESIAPLKEQELEALLEIIREQCLLHDVIILSDYAKGLLDARLCEALQQQLARHQQEHGRTIKILVDPKPQNFHLFRSSHLMTPNRKETGEGIHMPVHSQEEVLAAGRAILTQIGCTHLLSTLGAEGMALFLSPEEVWHIPTVGRDVFDVTGAGDTVIATIALALAAELPLLTACMLANYAAGIVVGKVGAATANPAELIDAIRNHPPAPPTKWS